VKRKKWVANRRMSTPIGSSVISRPEDGLQSLAAEALQVSMKARRHRHTLGGSGFYASKLAELRSSAAIELKKLASNPQNDVGRLEALSHVVFDPRSKHHERLSSCRDLIHELKVSSWSSTIAPIEGGLFPLPILSKTGRGYMVSVGTQMNGCFNSGWCDAAAVMLRRLIETAIIEAFESHSLDTKIKNQQGDFFQLSELVNAALNERSWNLSRNTKKALPNLRDVGHLSAHSRRYNAHKSALAGLATDIQVVVQEFLHLAKLI
jgi:hypothetical protein